MLPWRKAAFAASVGLYCFSVQGTPRLPTLQDLQIGYPGATLSLSHDERWIAAETNGRLILLTYPQGKFVAELGDGLLPQWAPTDSRLAFYSTRSGTVQLWIWDHDFGARQVTFLPEGIDADVTTRFLGVATDALQYAWSTDSRKLVFASRVGVLHEAVSKDEPLVLTNSTPPELTTEGMCALPAFCAIRMRLRGRELLMEAARRGEQLVSQLFIADSRTGLVNQLTTGARDLFNPVWSNDGTAIIAAGLPSAGGVGGIWQTLTHGESPPQGEIAWVDARTGSILTVRQTNGLARHLRMLKTGSLLAYIVSDSPTGKTSLEIVDIARSDDAPTRCNRIVEDLQWLKNGTLAISYRKDNGNFIAEIEPSHCTPSDSLPADLAFGAWALDKRKGALWIDGNGTLRHSPAGTKTARELFRFQSTELLLGREEAVFWHNSRGEKLQGFILYPPQLDSRRPYPLIVDAYPFAHPHGWMHSMGANHAWAAAGYAVFMPGQRAPHAWMNAADAAFGTKGKGPEGSELGVDDVLSGVDELARRGVTDPDRMCLYGHSNGGGAVSYIVTQTKRFKCAVVAAPVGADWLTWPVIRTDGRKEARQLSGGLDFDRDIEAFIAMSAVSKLHKSKTPMLVVTGDNDTTTDAIGIYNAVREAGTEVTLVRYPGQGHVLTGKAMEDFWKRQMAFFRKYLGVSRDIT